jgi:hypothetical protein
MYQDLLLDHLAKSNQNEQKPIDKRFQGIYKPEENSSSSSSDDEQEKFGYKKLSTRKKQKLINYLFLEINSSR